MAKLDHKSAAEIERDIEEERSALTRTLDEIHDRLSFESLTGDLVERVRDSGGDIGRSVVRGVRANPIPLALTAMGVAWLIAGRYSSSDEDPYERAAATPASVRLRGTSTPADLSDPDALVDPAPLFDSAGRPLPRQGDAPRRGRATQGVREMDDESSWGVTRGLANASASLSRRTREAYASAAELRRRISHGTEEMSAIARKRVIAARTRAYEAQLRAETYAARSRETATGLYDGQPLVAGAIALAFGAAIGALLPRTRREDDVFGTYRDRVMEEAERIYHEERSRLDSAARDAGHEMAQVARDIASNVRSDLEKGAQEAGDIARAKFAEAGSEIRDAVDDDAGTDGTDAPAGGPRKLRKV